MEYLSRIRRVLNEADQVYCSRDDKVISPEIMADLLDRADTWAVFWKREWMCYANERTGWMPYSDFDAGRLIHIEEWDGLTWRSWVELISPKSMVRCLIDDPLAWSEEDEDALQRLVDRGYVFGADILEYR